MKRQILTLFLTLVLLISVGGVVSIVGVASHVTPGQVAKTTVKAQSCPYVGNSNTGVYHYANCYWATIMKPEHRVCFNSPCDALAAGYRPCGHCNPPASC
ncbi:MAG: Ada metal-binding domain-containing protein [Halobacteriota archaeon]